MRLSKNIKAAILNAAIAKSGIKEREAAIRSRYAAWAEAVRVRYVTPEVEAAIEAARAASNAVANMFKERSFSPEKRGRISVNVAGQRREYYWNGDDNYDPSDYHEKLCPDRSATLTADDHLTEQLWAIDDAAKALKDEREQLTVSLNAVLDSVSTDKQLIAVWPEAVAFIPAAERASSPQLPALPIADLNRMIGLP